METITNFTKERPTVVAIASLVLGVILGLIFAWGIWPVEWKDAPVELLRPDLRLEYMSMPVHSFRVNAG